MQLGVSKIMILDYCKKPRLWSEIVKKTKLSEPTILVHTRDLIRVGLLEKINGEYKANFKNKEMIKLAKQIVRLQTKFDKGITKLINGDVRK